MTVIRLDDYRRSKTKTSRTQHPSAQPRTHAVPAASTVSSTASEPTPLRYAFTDPVLRDAHHYHCQNHRATMTPDITEDQIDAIDDDKNRRELAEAEVIAEYVRAADTVLRPYNAFMLDGGDVYTMSPGAVITAQQRDAVLHELHNEHLTWDDEDVTTLGDER